MVDAVTKTIGIKLNLTAEQREEVGKLLEAFRIGINWSLKQIEERYQAFLRVFEKIPKDARQKGICAGCHTEQELFYVDKTTHQKYCTICAKVSYSQYAVRKEIYGTDEREVEQDLKDVVGIPSKTHYDSLFSQAYGLWTSFNGWRNKREREKAGIEAEFSKTDPKYLKAAMQIEEKASDKKERNKKLIWKTAVALAAKEVYQDFPEDKRKKISNLHDKFVRLRRLKKPMKLPELKEARTAMMDKSFVKWDGDRLLMTLFESGKKEIQYWGKEYLEEKEFIPKMQDDMVRCNLTKKGEDYYLMYPLEIRVKQPPDLKECDTFVFMSSPTKTAIISYDRDGAFDSVKWFPTGRIAFAKRHFKEKRAEITSRKSPEEKMRKIRRRRKRIKRMGNIEQRTVSTADHQLTREIVDYIISQSENPKLLIWDIGNGITQNFGKQLNYLKSMWPAVQQQEYLKHKAMQISIPIVEIPYNEANNLTCSKCGKEQKDGKKTMKTITQLIKNTKNFKCQDKECKYETSMLINQANNLKDVAVDLYKGSQGSDIHDEKHQNIASGALG